MKANLHIVEFIPVGYEDKYPYKVGEQVLLIEIEDMPGNCALITRERHAVWACHIDDFRTLSEDET